MSGFMCVTIEYYTSKLPFSLEGADTFGNIKWKIQSQWSFEPSKQHLWFDGKEMYDNQQLYTHYVVNGSTLYLTVDS